MFRRYRYRLYPTEAQKVLMDKHFGCVRWVYNWALETKMKAYEADKTNVSIYQIQGQLPTLKASPETEWLAEVSSQALHGALHHLDEAYTRFFKGQSCFPQFKSRHSSHHSFENVQNTKVHFARGTVQILKFKEGIKCHFSRTFEGTIKTSTVSRTPTGKYYISILVETPDVEPVPVTTDEAHAIGLDFGLKDLIVTSDGQRFINPKHLKRFMRTLAIRQRRLSRKVKGSKNRDKARKRVAAVHEHISNIRRDHLHKVSSTLVRENQATTLCIENLDVKRLLEDRKKGKSMRRAIADVGWGELRRQLEYKCKWAGKNLRVIGEFEPSSKTCSACGSINRTLTLAQREWTCHCGVTHDRDINAAINIRKMAFREQNTYSTPAAKPTKAKRGKQASVQRTGPSIDMATGRIIVPVGSREVTPEEQAVRPVVSRECQGSASPI